jgi:hypothetical protein
MIHYLNLFGKKDLLKKNYQFPPINRFSWSKSQGFISIELISKPAAGFSRVP